MQRYIWFARLSDELLELVDRKKIGLVQGVDISFLSEDAQQWVLVILEESGANISHSTVCQAEGIWEKRRTDAADGASDTDRGKAEREESYNQV